MPEGPSSTGAIPRRRPIWRACAPCCSADESEETLRDRLEEAIDEHEDEAPAKGRPRGPIERQMLRNLLHFGERDRGRCRRAARGHHRRAETTSFADLGNLFAEAGHSRLPVYRDSSIRSSAWSTSRMCSRSSRSARRPPESSRADPPAALRAGIDGRARSARGDAPDAAPISPSCSTNIRAPRA
jgi:hypothetical protein